MIALVIVAVLVGAAFIGLCVQMWRDDERQAIALLFGTVALVALVVGLH